MGKSESQGYITPYRPVKLDENFEKTFKSTLVDTPEKLKKMLLEIKDAKMVAVDTETNGTDWGYSHIVGVSLSINAYSGYYIPVRHEEDVNLDIKYLKAAYKVIKDKPILMYNSCFDITMLTKEGWDFTNVQITDVMGLAYLMDTNIHLPSLKDMARQFLGRQSPTFEQTLKGREHFGFVPTTEAVNYAAQDTANTFGLYRVLYPVVIKECTNAFKLDNTFCKVLLKLCNTKLSVRQDLVVELQKYYQEELSVLEKDIFSAVGYPFNLRSNTQLEQAFKQLIQGEYPFVKSMIQYKSMASTLSSLKKFNNLDYIRCNYEMYNTVTGRLSSGSAKEEGKLNLPKGVRPYFDKFNAQNFLKSKEIYYKLYEAPDDPYAILGYRFKPIEKSDIQPDDKIVECMDYKGNTRRLINCCKRDENGLIIHDERDSYWVKNDYAGAELKLATLFSKEPVLMEAFLEGIDPHTNTAKAMFNVTDKPHRGKAKTCLGEKVLVRTNHGLKYPKDLNTSDKLLDYNGNYIDYIITTEEDSDMVKVEWSNGIIEEYSQDHKVAVWTGKNVEYKCIMDILPEEQVLGIGKQEQWETKPYTWEAKDWYSLESTSKHRNLKIDISNNTVGSFSSVACKVNNVSSEAFSIFCLIIGIADGSKYFAFVVKYKSILDLSMLNPPLLIII